MNPTHTAVSPSVLSRVLDAMDGRDTVTLRILSEQTGLGTTTVSRAVQKVTRLGILSMTRARIP
jgi:DNA-binding IclR family transcriptional regulator